jgi:3-methyladenine DNA glycosylase AlkD
MYSEELLKTVQDLASEEKRIGMETYMKNHFSFLGTPSELRKQGLRQHIQKFGLPTDDQFESVVKSLWKMKNRELNYCAQELVLRKKWFLKRESIRLIEWMITNDSWWDTVDFIAASLVGSYFNYFPERKEEIVRQWNTSGNMWLIRSSILFQLKYKEKTDTDFLSQLILPHLESREFFIQKAIGWSLREVSKTNPEFVKAFIASHYLKPVSQREAIKYI